MRSSGGKARARDDRTIRFRASTNSVDRHGTIIRPEGIDTSRFDRNPVFLLNHDGYSSMFGKPSIDFVIGRVIDHTKSRQAFDITVEFATIRPRRKLSTWSRAASCRPSRSASCR